MSEKIGGMMAKYLLTERQKDLLRSLVPGLQDNTLETLWGFVSTFGSGLQTPALRDKPELYSLWKSVTQADIDTFAEYGFFRHKGGNSYTLNPALIIDAVNSNFGEDEIQVQRIEGHFNQLILAPVFGIPPKSSQYLADIFMLMPFHEAFRPIYYDHIKPIAQEIGRSINRGDDFFSKHSIMTDIWSAIYYSRLVIADCTGKNANVFYELGIAHTVGKSVIMITQNEADIPFDVRDKRYIKYEYPGGMNLFEQQLKDAIMKVLNDAG
jgi:hypothetical protein